MTSIPLGVKRRGLQTLLALPSPLRAQLSKRQPARVSGKQLSGEAQFLLWLSNLAGEPDLSTLTPESSRQQTLAITEVFGFRGPEVRRVRDLAITGPGGDVPARLYVPRGATERGPLVVYFHGGGFVDGNLDSIDGVCRFLSAESRIRLLSVAYRKAPEHPFPTAVEDARSALSWAQENAHTFGVDPSRIGVGGDSSGANLAAVVCLLARDDGGPPPVSQLLIYPVVDATRKTESYFLFGERFGLTAAKYEWFLDHYATQDQRADFRVSPLLANDLSKLPSAHILTAGFDILHDEGAAYAERLRDAGVSVDYRCSDDLFHGFIRFYEIIPSARSALEEAAISLRQHLCFRNRTP